MSEVDASIPTTARTVIIGAGAVGCSVAYHLAREGRRDVVVLERSKLTSGTTWHAAGLVRRLRPSATLTRLIKDSIDLYKTLEAETGQHTGWRQTGSLAIATNDDRWTHLKRQVSLGHAFGLDAELVDTKQAQALWPLLNTDDVIGGVWSPADGRVNPSDVAQALAKGARLRGVRFFEDTPVTGFEKRGQHIHAVRTPNATIQCEEVVIACGLWSRDVAALAEAHVPLFACEHFYILTKSITAIDRHLPTLNDQDAYLYARDEVGGLLVGCFEPNAKPLPISKLPKDFSFSLLNEDWDHFAPMMDNAIRRIPALEHAEVRMLLNGPESFTLDNQFMLGESPQVDGLYVIAGMNSTGIALSGGAGRAMAEWIIEGEPTMELTEADIQRFAPENNVLGALCERIPEVLGRHYELSYPGRQLHTARGQRRSALHDALTRAGAYFNARNGWERAEFFAPGENPSSWPLSFAEPAWQHHVGREHQAALHDAVLFDQSAFGKILIQGQHSEGFLNRLCANNVSVRPGRIVYTSILNARGGIESDLTVHRLEPDAFLLVVGSGELTRVKALARRQRFDHEHVAITDLTSAYTVIGLVGPRAGAVIRDACADNLPSIARFDFCMTELGYAPARVSHLSYTGEDGYEIELPTDFAASAYEALIRSGAAHGLRHAGTLAVACLRIEAGFRAWGHELTPGVTPMEAGLERFVALEKDEVFLGRDALLAKHSAPITRRIAALLLSDPQARPLHDEPVWYAGRVVGQVTSATWSYRLDRCITLALLDAPLDLLQTQDVVDGFQVEIACQRFDACASLSAPRDVFPRYIA